MRDDQIIEVVQQVTHGLARASFQAADQATRALLEPKAKNLLAMLGDYLRDASVLIIIFVPIEILLPDYLNGKAVDPRVLRWTIWISICTLAAGVILEKLSAWLEKRMMQ